MTTKSQNDQSTQQARSETDMGSVSVLAALLLMALAAALALLASAPQALDAATKPAALSYSERAPQERAAPTFHEQYRVSATTESVEPPTF